MDAAAAAVEIVGTNRSGKIRNNDPAFGRIFFVPPASIPFVLILKKSLSFIRETTSNRYRPAAIAIRC